MSWLNKFLGGWGKRRVERQKTNPDDLYESNKDILEGYEYIATLHLSTPLHILEKHGKLFVGPKENAPEYGNQAQGIWVPKLKDGLAGSDWRNSAYETPQASDVGHVKAADYLPFLKAYRRVVESDESIPRKIDAIKSLGNESDRFRGFIERLGKAYDDFPESVFYRELTRIPGIGMTTARRLFELGYLCIDDLKNADAGELRKINGIGKKVIQSIREY